MMHGPCQVFPSWSLDSLDVLQGPVERQKKQPSTVESSSSKRKEYLGGYCLIDELTHSRILNTVISSL